MTRSERAGANRTDSTGTTDSDMRKTENSETESDNWMEQVWSAGSYSEIAPNFVPMGGHLVERTDVAPDDEVLDIGCGTGSVTITAARRGAEVTGIDITPTLLDHARTNAEIAGVDDISWRDGDAAALPFEDDTFDVVLSNLGHMYGDPPDAAARELLRVTQHGGRIGFTSWTPTSLYPSIAGAVMTALSPDDLPDFTEPPFMWGESEIVRRRLGESVEDLTFETGAVQYPVLSPEHFWKQTATNSGLFAQVLETIDDDMLPELRTQVVETIEPYFDNRENMVELEYLLTTATIKNSE